MKVLVIADVAAGRLYDYYTPGRLKDYDLIISCGDLKKEYLEFLVTMARCPLIYVRGNHDGNLVNDPPEGCICIEDSICEYNGLRFLGLGGSMRYNDSNGDQYSESQMKRRIRRLFFTLRKYKGFDVLVTHAPAKGLGDLEDIPHRGFECFVELLDKYKPRLHVHGHIHMNYGSRIKRKLEYNETAIINAFESYEIEL